MKIPMEEVDRARHKILLEDGRTIVAMETYGRSDLSDIDYSNNVFCVNADGSIAWRVIAPKSAFGRDSFTAVTKDDDRIVAIRESGARFVVDQSNEKSAKSKKNVLKTVNNLFIYVFFEFFFSCRIDGIKLKCQD